MNSLRHIISAIILTMVYAADASANSIRDSIAETISGCCIAEYTIALDAKGDGSTDCLPAFKKAIAKAAKLSAKYGAVRIVIPEGTYLINGPLHLVSNLTLDLSEGATLKFSDNPAHYLPVVDTSWEGTFCKNYSPFIYGKDLHDVAIIGKGTIDGNADSTFATWRTLQSEGQQLTRSYNHSGIPPEERIFGEGYNLRPHLIQFYNCSNVTVEGVFITRSPFWCVHLLHCENVVCRSLRFDARLENNDGIDPESSRNILIEDIEFNNGDDNIAIKSGRDNDGRASASPSENIVIRRCKFKGLHAVVIGSEMSGGVRNIWIDDCTYGGYCKRGLYIKTNPDRGAFIHDIYMNNCRFGEVEDLIYITSMFAGEGLDNHYFTDIHDIHVSNVTCSHVHKAAIVLQGTANRPIHDVSFENVSVDHAVNGINMTHTEEITLKNCNLGSPFSAIPSTASTSDKIFR